MASTSGSDQGTSRAPCLPPASRPCKTSVHVPGSGYARGHNPCIPYSRASLLPVGPLTHHAAPCRRPIYHSCNHLNQLVLTPLAPTACLIACLLAADFSLFVGDLAQEVNDQYLDMFFRSYFTSVKHAKVRGGGGMRAGSSGCMQLCGHAAHFWLSARSAGGRGSTTAPWRGDATRVCAAVAPPA